MTFEIWVTFVFAASANILAPGPAIVLAIRNGLSLGMRKTIYSTLGNVVAIGCVGLAVTLGLGAIITTEPGIFSVLRVLGGSYLLWLAYQNWQRGMISLDHLCVDNKDAKNTNDDAGADTNSSVCSFAASLQVQRSAPYLFRQSLLVGLTNPKMIIFLLALFPLFLNTQAAATPQLLLMTATFMGLSFLSLSAFAYTAVKLSRLIRQPSTITFINKLIAIIFFGFGSSLVCFGLTTM
ncbi:LysE family translocator [Kiloniella sp. EL199]|uniref:LysE family translocator n=1 Tax=Kiloniella sp. EL199 TaxID=2107581 RepID=UPI000EA15961|nr:LysE family translocator [Kiloniella sp. EL199]